MAETFTSTWPSIDHAHPGFRWRGRIPEADAIRMYEYYLRTERARITRTLADKPNWNVDTTNGYRQLEPVEKPNRVGEVEIGWHDRMAADHPAPQDDSTALDAIAAALHVHIDAGQALAEVTAIIRSTGREVTL